MQNNPSPQQDKPQNTITIANLIVAMLIVASVTTSLLEMSAVSIVTGGLATIILIVLMTYTFIQNRSTSRTSNGNRLFSGDSSHETSDVILQAITDGVVLCEANGQISSMNEAAAKMTGWNASDAQNLDFQSVLIFADKDNQPLERDQSPVQLAITRQATVRQTLKLFNQSDKKTSYTDVVVSPTAKDEAGVTEVVAVLRDVDSQVKQDADRSDFVSTASHEMRTPVAAIRGFLELALNPKICSIDDNAKKYLQKAYDSTEHLGKLFQDLLTVSRSEDGRLPNQPIKINVGNFIKELVEQLHFSTDAKGLSLNAQFDNVDIKKPGLVAPNYFVFVDPDRLREAITGLFENAVKYTEKGGVSLKLSGTQNTVSVAIHDSGIGIPAEDIPHLFQKFYRVDNTATREIGGTGLGLYICKEIVESMHGKVLVDSHEGVGSTFTIELPRVN